MRSFPEFRTCPIFSFIVVETSPAWKSGASPVTFIAVLPVAISRVTFTVPGGRSTTLILRLSLRNPSWVMVKMYLLGFKKNGILV